MTTVNWNQLIEDHEIARLRANICLGSSESYSLEEKRQICVDMEASSAEVDAALRKNFEALPPEAQAEMLDLLQQADPGNFAWWFEILVGEMPNTAPALA